MKGKLIELLREFLVIQMNHWVIATFFITILGFFEKKASFLGVWLLLCVVPVCQYVIRKKIQNFFVFFLLHFLILTVIIVAPIDNIACKILSILMTVLYIAWSVHVKIMAKTVEEGPLHPIFAATVIGLSSILHDRLGHDDWNVFYIAAIICFFLCFYIYNFMERYMYFMSVNKFSASNIPEAEIFSSGMKQTLAYTAGGLVVFLLTANLEWFSYVVKTIGYGILGIIRFLLSLLGGSTEDLSEAEEHIFESAADNSGFVAVEEEPFLLWKILEYIVLTAVTILIIAVILYGIVKLFRFLWKNFYSQTQSGEAKILSNMDVRETCVIEKEVRALDMRVFGFKNNREKVRKLYKKEILKNKNTIIGDLETENLKNLTAKECCDKISAQKLQQIYEKARYSEDVITSEDLRTIRNRNA